VGADLDRRTLRALADVADLSKPRLVEHFLYVPSREAGEQAAEELVSRGYTANIREADGEGGLAPWLVLASQTAVVNEESVREARELLEGLAERHGGEYDGWGAEADEEPPPSKGWRRLFGR
jgi:regulator of RNase E activity RraB